MAPDQEDYDRDCPLCGSTTTIRNPSHASVKFRNCDNYDCNWAVMKGGSWTSPHRPEDFPVGSIGWEEAVGE